MTASLPRSHPTHVLVATLCSSAPPLLISSHSVSSVLFPERFLPRVRHVVVHLSVYMTDCVLAREIGGIIPLCIEVAPEPSSASSQLSLQEPSIPDAVCGCGISWQRVMRTSSTFFGAVVESLAVTSLLNSISLPVPEMGGNALFNMPLATCLTKTDSNLLGWRGYESCNDGQVLQSRFRNDDCSRSHGLAVSHRGKESQLALAA